MEEIIQPNGSTSQISELSKDTGSAGYNASHLTQGEKETGGTTEESHNSGSPDLKSKDEGKQGSVLGKVREKAQQLKSKVKRGLKIGDGEEKEERNDEEDSSSDAKADGSENAQFHELQIKHNVEDKPVHEQITGAGSNVRSEGQSQDTGAPSLGKLVEDGKKPISPFKNDGPEGALQAVPTQYRDNYHNASAGSDEAVAVGQVNPSGYESNANSNPSSAQNGQIAGHSSHVSPLGTSEPKRQETSESVGLSQQAINVLISAKDSLADVISKTAEGMKSPVSRSD